MKKSINKPFPGSKTKFYNFYKGKDSNKYFFLLPSIAISPKKNLNWDIKIRSIFFGWGNWFIQFNICETVSDTSLELTKEYYEELKKCLLASNITITDIQGAMNFIKNNIYIVQILRNSNTDHIYVKRVLASFFQNQPFVSM